MKKSKEITCSIPIAHACWTWENEVCLKPNSTYTLIVSYPLDKEYSFPIKVGKSGMGSFGLVSKVGQIYDQIYAEESKYGVWGHGIDDLCLEGFNIDHKTKKIKLYIGS